MINVILFKASIKFSPIIFIWVLCLNIEVMGCILWFEYLQIITSLHENIEVHILHAFLLFLFLLSLFFLFGSID